MDDKTATRLRKRAIFSATRKGFSEQSEDLAHDAILNWLEGRGQHQTVDQAVTDAIRGTYGKPGSPGRQLRRALLRSSESMDELENQASASIDQDSSDDFERFIKPLESVERAIVWLIYVWGFKAIEVAHCFGVTESRISQRLKEIQSRLSQSMAVKECSPMENVQQEVQAIRERQKIFKETMEDFLREKACAGSELERATNIGMAEKEFWSMETTHEESFPEWFA